MEEKIWLDLVCNIPKATKEGFYKLSDKGLQLFTQLDTH